MNLLERIMKNTNIGGKENIRYYLGFLPQEILDEYFTLSKEAENQLYRLIDYLHKNFKDSYNYMEYTELSPDFKEGMYKINMGLEYIMYRIKTDKIDFTPLIEMSLEDKIRGKEYEIVNIMYLDYILNNEPLFILDFYGSYKRCELNDEIKGYIKGEEKTFIIIDLLGHKETNRKDGKDITRRRVQVLDKESNKKYFIEWTSLGGQEVDDFNE